MANVRYNAVTGRVVYNSLTKLVTYCAGNNTDPCATVCCAIFDYRTRIDAAVDVDVPGNLVTTAGVSTWMGHLTVFCDDMNRDGNGGTTTNDGRWRFTTFGHGTPAFTPMRTLSVSKDCPPAGYDQWEVDTAAGGNATYYMFEITCCPGPTVPYTFASLPTVILLNGILGSLKFDSSFFCPGPLCATTLTATPTYTVWDGRVTKNGGGTGWEPIYPISVPTSDGMYYNMDGPSYGMMTGISSDNTVILTFDAFSQTFDFTFNNGPDWQHTICGDSYAISLYAGNGQGSGTALCETLPLILNLGPG